MSYKIKRKKAITETLVLTDDNDTIIETLNVEMSGDAAYLRFMNARKNLTKCQKDFDNSPTDDKLENFGKAMVIFFEAIFGAENVAKLIKYYDNNYIEMFEDITPFIVDKVYPIIAADTNKRVKNIKAMRSRFGK